MGQLIVPTLAELRKVLFEWNKHGYSSETVGISRRADGLQTVVWESGRWRFEDAWDGGEPYGGRIRATFNRRPYWFCGYYGRVEPGEDHKVIYGALRQSLRAMPRGMPLRGPADFLCFGDYSGCYYHCVVDGDIDNFVLREWIDRADRAYWGMFIGGLVDQRRGKDAQEVGNMDKLRVGAA
jgi:hypothetical protein